METKSRNQITQGAILNDLLLHHTDFQEYLDIVSSSDIDNELIEILIEIRQFNIDCISKYTDLISKDRVYIRPKKSKLITTKNKNYKDPLVLGNINTRLSLLMPAYVRVLSNRSLIGFARMIVANNFEKIVQIKDNLLHPLPELQSA
ncbi:MAG: hypothetical protein HKN67_08910 [Saprospiraceae bacterium]|nr:hypothetical protein [Saprospiraceae bacterium]NNK90214.1 hypothetical protein [Saprospiraceae bacterium]